MAQPDFSEFSFGYGVTRYFEELYAARQVLPTFPTQNEEADGGYDVEFLDAGVPLFIQFKRSEVMTRRNATEWLQHPNDWVRPVYRMHLHGHNEYRQHYLMQELEANGQMAVYITSQVPSRESLNYYYSRDRIMDAARMFLPSEIMLPSTDERHHVSFNRNNPVHRVYSTYGEKVVGRLQSMDEFWAMVRAQEKRSPNQIRKSLHTFVEDVRKLSAEGVAERQRKSHDVERGRLRSRYDDELNGRFQAYRDQDELDDGYDRDSSYFNLLDSVESIAKRAAIVAYREADAHLFLISRLGQHT